MTSEFVDWSEAKTVLVIFESDILEQNADLRNFIERLMKTEGKKVSACLYVDKKEALTPSLDNFVVLDKKCVDLWGHQQSAVAQRMVEEDSFDIIIDLTTTFNITLSYLLMELNARMRCGMKKPETQKGLYDMQIEMTTPDFGEDEEAREAYNERVELAEQILKYLKLIHSKI